jgi:hypothetical protein
LRASSSIPIHLPARCGFFPAHFDEERRGGEFAREKNMRLASVLIGSLIVLSGCSHYPGGIAPSTIPLAPGGYTVVEEEVRGSDCLVELLMILPVSNGNRTDTAVRNAILSAPGATALVNVTSDSYTQRWILWSNTCTEVRGTAVKAH